MDLSKIIFCCAMMASAVVLSCTDHDIADPGTTCTRVDGTPRDYPCEFEIVKAEFCNKLDINEIIATVTSTSQKVTLPVSAAWSYYHPSPGFADITYKIKLHIKRVSNPSFTTSNQYIIPKTTGRISDLPKFLGINQFPPIFPPLPATLSMSIGETSVVILDAFYHAKEDFQQPSNKAVYSDILGNIMYLIYNMKTAENLAGPPHSYQNILDIAESHITIDTALTE